MNGLVPGSESVEGFGISFSREITIQNLNYNIRNLRSDDAFYKVVRVLGSRNQMDLFRRDLTCTLAKCTIYNPAIVNRLQNLLPFTSGTWQNLWPNTNINCKNLIHTSIDQAIAIQTKSV